MQDDEGASLHYRYGTCPHGLHPYQCSQCRAFEQNEAEKDKRRKYENRGPLREDIERFKAWIESAPFFNPQRHAVWIDDTEHWGLQVRVDRDWDVQTNGYETPKTNS